MPSAKGRYTVEIANQQRGWRVDTALLKRVARATLAAEEVAQAQISLALVDDPSIHRVNRDFLGHDQPTDVISFLYESLPSPKTSRARHKPKNPPRGAGQTIAGEIIISVETVVRCAGELGCAPRDELLLYLVHGLLHLCGYDDMSRDERRAMRSRERQLLLPFNVSPHVDGRSS